MSSTDSVPGGTGSASSTGSAARRVVLAADHAGVELKAKLLGHLQAKGLDVVDLGPNDTSSVDYPDFAHALAREVHEGRAGRGVLVCGTGVGMAMAANRWSEVRAVNCTDLFTVRMAREHNDANVLALGARVLGVGLALELVDVFLETSFAGDRHTRRVRKIDRQREGCTDR